MADNPTSPDATTFRADDAASIFWPYTKLAFGPGGTQTIVEDGVGLPVVPFAAILEGGIKSLIGVNDGVAVSGELSGTADFSLGATMSGEILSFLLVSSETDAGSIQGGKGTVMFFDADPNTTPGDTDLAAAGAEHKTIVGQVPVEADEWDKDANGGTLFKTVALPFHAIATIYAVFRNTDTVANWNSGGTDDEMLDINMWFRRDS